jgi:hypothetical protein
VITYAWLSAPVGSGGIVAGVDAAGLRASRIIEDRKSPAP